MIRINRLQQRMPHLLPKMHSLIKRNFSAFKPMRWPICWSWAYAHRV
jgi:hypothetical protein